MTDLNDAAAGHAGRGGGRTRSRDDDRSPGDVRQAVAEVEQADDRARAAALAQATAQVAEAAPTDASQGNGSVPRDALVSAARVRLIRELRELDRLDGRQRLEQAATASDDAVAAAVQGVGTLVISALPAAVADPLELVDTAFGLAELGLHALHRLTRETVGIVRIGITPQLAGAR